MKKIALYTLGTIVSLMVLMTGLIGFSHTPIGQPYLGKSVQKLYRYMGAYAGMSCPLGFDQTLTIEQREQRRARLAEASTAYKQASYEIALFNMQLKKTLRSEVESWVKAQGGECKKLNSDFEIECSGPFLNSQISTLWLEFDRLNRLVTSRGVTKYQDLQIAQKQFENMYSDLNKQNSDSTKVAILSQTELQKNLLGQSVFQANFNNLQASVRITNLGKEFALSHEYLAF